MIVTLPLGIINIVDPVVPGERAIMASLCLALSPLAVCFVFVFTASLVIGIPFTFMLEHAGLEKAAIYDIAGSLLGALIPAATLLLGAATDGYWICILGAIAGGTAAHVWWLERHADV